MQKKIVHSIVTSSSKLSVLIDEASSISHTSAMIVNLKASVDGATLEFLFLELVELESQRAKDIEEALLNCLDTAGFTEEWLQMNWVSFVSDGASVMLGKNSGVARVELAVSDAVDEVQAVNHFKVFLEKIHNLYISGGQLDKKKASNFPTQTERGHGGGGQPPGGDPSGRDPSGRGP
ncbi:hypothetical protein NHX12_023715 [Muraenolepis orangiensis]|uniref:DUF4371 domain-containing protein n=1 Tax=Muraenolepis orangiensis TaxID=630683 RepID=A0A9Q0IU28_9TELE|nr:hypothetical protein NHX12_023715 [Muraenolepis orangiensis]